MTNNRHPSASDPASPSVGYCRNRSNTAQKSQHDASEDIYPQASQPESTAVTERSDLDLPMETEGAGSARTVAGEALDDIAETRRELLDRLART